MVVGYLGRKCPLEPVANAHGGVASYGPVFKKMCDSFERERGQLLAQAMPSDNLSFMTDPERNALERASDTPNGRERLAMLQKALDSFGLKRSKNQRWFHRQFTQSIIRKLFKDDLAENLDALREEFGVDEFKSEVMVVTPRRWGKTYSVAMFVAACAASVERNEQAIFSTGRRASEKLLQLIYQMICKLPGMRESIIKKNVETIWLQGPCGPDDIRKISSYPSKTQEPEQGTLQHFLFSFNMAALEQTIGDLMQTRECLRCHAFFTTMDDIGRWSCRVHPGTLQAVAAWEHGTARGTFSCCGISPMPTHAHYRSRAAAAGCVRCDHSIRRGKPATLIINLERARVLFGDALLRGDRPGIIVDEPAAAVHVIRYEEFGKAKVGV